MWSGNEDIPYDRTLRCTPGAGELAAIAAILLAATAVPMTMSGADLPIDYAVDSPWPKATRASDAPPVSVPAHFKGKNGSGGGAARVFASGSRGIACHAWWTVFGDPVLNDLEHDALTENQDLQQALARVTEARLQARAAAADFFPHLQAPLHAARLRTTDTGPVLPVRIVGEGAAALTKLESKVNPLFGKVLGPVEIPSTISSQLASTTFNDFQVPLQLSYEVDIFGRIRHTYGQARASAQATHAERRAVELRLAAEVATDYFALRALDAAIAVLRRTRDLRRHAVLLQQKRLGVGAANKLDYSRAEVELNNTDADLNDAVRQRAEVENALGALCGYASSDFRIPSNPLANLPPPTAPAGVPSALLTQRPDLIEAERRLAAASEGVGVARANLFPTVNIQGNYGYESAKFGQVFEDRSHVWSVFAGISVPIFEGGRNQANLRAARASRDEAFAAYKQTAVTAFKEAENALIDLQQRISQSADRESAVANSTQVLDLSEKRYLEGAISYFEVIDAQRLVLNAELSRVQTLNACYTATVDLVRAFGGGYGSPNQPQSPASPLKASGAQTNAIRHH